MVELDAYVDVLPKDRTRDCDAEMRTRVQSMCATVCAEQAFHVKRCPGMRVSGGPQLMDARRVKRTRRSVSRAVEGELYEATAFSRLERLGRRHLSVSLLEADDRRSRRSNAPVCSCGV